LPCFGNHDKLLGSNLRRADGLRYLPASKLALSGVPEEKSLQVEVECVESVPTGPGLVASAFDSKSLAPIHGPQGLRDTWMIHHVIHVRGERVLVFLNGFAALCIELGFRAP
jgi:hypothetical protein